MLNRRAVWSLAWMVALAVGAAACTPAQFPLQTANPSGAVSSRAEMTPQASPALPNATMPPLPTQAPSKTSAPSPTIIPDPMTPTPTTVSCLTLGGSIEKRQVASSLLPDPLEFRVYLPPCYAADAPQRYPVLYLLHGQGSTDDQWDRLGVDEIADRLIASGEIPPLVIVMPRDPYLAAQPDTDPFGEAIVQDLIPWIDRQYRSLPARAGRAIGGLSRGASWSVHIGLSHWELFSSLGTHSLPVFLKDVKSVPKWLDAIPPGDMPRFYIDISINDQAEGLASARWFEDLLTQRDIPHEWHLFTGYHDENYWQAHLEQYLRWYGGAWQDGEK